jgi:hypothetical protein
MHRSKLRRYSTTSSDRPVREDDTTRPIPLCGLEIDDEFESCGQLHRYLAGGLAIKGFPDQPG